MRVIDRAGHVWAELAWDGDRLRELRVPGAVIDGAAVDDPLLGHAHRITCGDASTTMSALDWYSPTRIPTIADPAVLPPGAGAMIMNVIAMRARGACRYSGRYPTRALFRTLLRAFRTTAIEDDFTTHFGVERDVPVDFTPAPFERLGNPHGFVELRAQTGVWPHSPTPRLHVERAVVDRVSYEPSGSPARLVEGNGAGPLFHAELWFGDALYARVAKFDAAGALVDGPHPIPRCSSAVIGREFPPQLVSVLAELVAEIVPAPLARDVPQVLSHVRWVDLGPHAAAETPDGLAVHAVLWERIAPLGMARLALALAEALGPVVTRTLVRRISRDVALMSRSS